MTSAVAEGNGRVSIILPVHNQADHLRQVIGGYSAALDAQDIDWELVLVPNACTDDSAEIARELRSKDERIQVVELADGGWGRAVRAGLAHATGELIGYTNSARTSPEILLLILLYARVYPDVVVKANRRIRESRRRRLGSLLYNLECRALFDLSVWDVNGTPKIFPRKFDKLLSLGRDDDLIDAEFNAVCRNEGYPVVEVPILATVRHGGASTTNYGSAVRMYVGAWQLAKSMRRGA